MLRNLLLVIVCVSATALNNIAIMKLRSQRPRLNFLSNHQNNMRMSSSDEAYGPVGSLLRQGPVPFFIRLAKPDTYKAAVEKYMALEKCDRLTAQANMDAYFQDPNGWAGNKLRAKKTGLDMDSIYINANMDTKSLILTAIWAGGISFLAFRIYVVQVLGQ